MKDNKEKNNQNEEDKKILEENKEKLNTNPKENKQKTENKNNGKIGFFKSFKYSITKIEKYPEMAAQGVKKALKYAAVLTIIIAIVTSVGMIYNANKTVQESAKFIEENIPEFTYEDGKIKTEAQQPIILDDNKETNLGKIIIDVTELTEEQTNKYIDEINQYGDGMLVLQDKLIVKTYGIEKAATYNYSDILNQMQINTLNKQELINYMTQGQLTNIYISIFITLVLYLFIVLFIDMLCYALFIGLVGYLAGMLARIKLKFKAVFNMAIYALTLSVALKILYVIVNIFVNFNIQYFQVMYIVVASIYMIAAIFMLKDDVIRRQEELIKIQEVQKKVKEELDKQKDEEKKEKEKQNKKQPEDKKDKKEKTKKDKKGEKNEGPAPEGSNAIVDDERI